MNSKEKQIPIALVQNFFKSINIPVEEWRLVNTISNPRNMDFLIAEMIKELGINLVISKEGNILKYY